MSGLFGGGSKARTSPTRAMGIDFQGAQYGNVVPVVYGQNKVAGNCVWYGDFQSHAHQQKSGKGGGGGGGGTSYTYSASAQMGLCEGPGVSLVKVYDGTSVVDLSSINYAFASGAKGQGAWSHLSGVYALGYSLTAVFSFQNLDLGSQASLPNYNHEVKALKPFSSSIPDANPADILTDICSDPYHGINFPWLGSTTQYSNYCVANSLFLSPVYDQQASAQQNLSDLLKYTNSDAYYSDDQLKVAPRGDVAVTGNGVTYTPNVTPLVDLDDTDFLVTGAGDAPVVPNRKAPQDSLNVVRVEFKDRSNTYHDSAVVGAIDFDVVANGERSDDSETVNGCTSGSVARFIAQNLVQRAFYVRNTYQFRLPWNYCYLEPCDIVTLTDAALGLNKAPVRITSVEEDESSTLTIEAEEWPEGIGHSAIYGTQDNGGTNVDQNADPGAVNAPYLFRGPGFLVSNNTPEIWCACNGSGTMWAAADVYLSQDGSSYTYCGTIASQARYGELTTALPAGTADPDTTNTPKAQLYAPAQLLGGSQADADNFVTLAMVDTEIIGYENATLTGTNTYQMSYLRRGGYGSANVAHSIGAPFVRLDDSIFRMPVDPSLIGKTVYLKFLSINAFGRTPRTLADETAYTYVVGTNIELPDVPDVPTGFAVQTVADGVSLTWTNDNPTATGCTSVEYSTTGTGSWSVLAQVGPTTTAYHHSFTDGSTYYYRARARGPLAQSGWSAYTAVLESAGMDVSGTIGSSSTLINPQFNGWGANGSLHGWTVDSGTWVHQSGTNGPLSGTSSYAYRTGSSGTPNDAIRNTANFPVYPGAMVKASCLVRGTGSPNGSCRVRVSWRDATLAELSVTHGSVVTGNTTATSSVSAAAPAGAVIARVEADAISHTTGAYAVDNFTASSTADSLDQVPDGSTRFGSVQSPTNQLITAALALASSTPGANMIFNPLFALGKAGYQQFDTGWFTQTNNPSYGPDAAILLSSTAQTAIITTNQFPVTAGSAVSTAFEYVIQNAMTAGDLSADVTWYNSSGVVVSRSARLLTDSSASPGGTMIHLASPNLVAPAGIAFASFRVYLEGAKGSGYVLIRRLKAELGATCTPFNDDTTQAGNQLTIPGSGQTVGDQRNLNPVTWASARSAPTSLPISYTISGTTVSFSVAAFTLNGGGFTVSYSATSGSVTQSAGTTATYYLYYRDAASAGGAQTLHITIHSADLALYPDVIFVGTATVTVNSGGGGSGGTGGGGGGILQPPAGGQIP